MSRFNGIEIKYCQYNFFSNDIFMAKWPITLINFV